MDNQINGLQKLTEIAESEGFKIDTLNWPDGSKSYSFMGADKKPVLNLNKGLKERIEKEVPGFSHFGMGDVVHLKKE